MHAISVKKIKLHPVQQKISSTHDIIHFKNSSIIFKERETYL